MNETTMNDEALELDIIYGPEQQRWKSVLKKNDIVTKSTIFAGDYEKITENGITRHLYYISGGDGLAAVYVKQAGEPDRTYYAHTDHLGSIVKLTDNNGNPVFQASYDAWGLQEITNSTFSFHRGYTGHEHLPEFGLINMNGRMYHPVLGRFLSPDPFVQAPEYSQNFNRYSYCLNNPLVFTDPSGEFFFAAVGIGAFLNAACWGAVIGGATYTASIAMSNGGFDNWNWGQFGKTIGMGAISGMFTSGIGQGLGSIGSRNFIGEIYRASLHGFSQGVFSGLSGGDFMTGFASGGLSSLAGSGFMRFAPNFANTPLGNYTFSGLAGGIGAELTGGDFWQGAATGLMVAGLNHVQQGLAMPKKLEEKINEAFAQELKRRARPAPLFEPIDADLYISVDFEIDKPQKRIQKYVYKLIVNGREIEMKAQYDARAKNKTVNQIIYNSGTEEFARPTTTYYNTGKNYAIMFRNKTYADILFLYFKNVSDWHTYLIYKGMK